MVERGFVSGGKDVDEGDAFGSNKAVDPIAVGTVLPGTLQEVSSRR
jgi:hypothetical protein